MVKYRKPTWGFTRLLSRGALFSHQSLHQTFSFYLPCYNTTFTLLPALALNVTSEFKLMLQISSILMQFWGRRGRHERHSSCHKRGFSSMKCHLCIIRHIKTTRTRYVWLLDTILYFFFFEQIMRVSWLALMYEACYLCKPRLTLQTLAVVSTRVSNVTLLPAIRHTPVGK